MKKKTLAMAVLAMALVAVPTFSFGKESIETSTSTSGSTTQSTTQQVGTGASGTSAAAVTKEAHVAANGTVVAETGKTIDKSGTSIGFVVDAKTSTGVDMVSNNDGSISVGTVKLHFANGDAETAGLPNDVVDKINKLNSGAALNDVLGAATGVDLTGFTAVGNTRAIIAADSTTGLTNTATEFVMRVDKIDDSEMMAVYYDNNTGRWIVVPVVVDPVTKTVRLMVPGSCTVQLMKKPAAPAV